MFDKLTEVLNKKLFISQVILISFFLILLTTLLDISFYQGFLVENLSMKSIIYHLFSNIIIITPIIYLVLKQKNLLEENEKIYGSFFKYSKDPILIINEKGQILKMNSSTRKVLGYSEKDLVNKHFASLLPKKELDRNFSSFAQVFKGLSKTYKTYIVHKNNTILSISVLVIPIIINDQVIGAVGIIKDVTKKKTSEKEA